MFSVAYYYPSSRNEKNLRAFILEKNDKKKINEPENRRHIGTRKYWESNKGRKIAVETSNSKRNIRIEYRQKGISKMKWKEQIIGDGGK